MSIFNSDNMTFFSATFPIVEQCAAWRVCFVQCFSIGIKWRIYGGKLLSVAASIRWRPLGFNVVGVQVWLVGVLITTTLNPSLNDDGREPSVVVMSREKR